MPPGAELDEEALPVVPVEELPDIPLDDEAEPLTPELVRTLLVARSQHCVLDAPADGGEVGVAVLWA